MKFLNTGRSPHLGMGSREKGMRARNNPLFASAQSSPKATIPEITVDSSKTNLFAESTVIPFAAESRKNPVKPPPPSAPRVPPPPPKKCNNLHSALPRQVNEKLNPPKKEMSALHEIEDDVSSGSFEDFPAPNSSLQDVFMHCLRSKVNEEHHVECEDQWIVWSFDKNTFAHKVAEVPPFTAPVSAGEKLRLPMTESDSLTNLLNASQFGITGIDYSGAENSVLLENKNIPGKGSNSNISSILSHYLPLAAPSRWLKEVNCVMSYVYSHTLLIFTCR